MKHLIITTIAAALFGVGNTTFARDSAKSKPGDCVMTPHDLP
ncbi:MAG: hypothetical protein QGI20_00930 [Verrucomicrobiota bacterium]|jgi:hypothetical protein|nr:hypothetical protein [Verrucomicrobiota bacterium]MDP6250481.1 hypothetical protein [Verrucomicrobiota bacterium]|tara:strand:+ start:363 stop:488 length:126 start_codon:yes stop_codon:yes gene_type:complete